MAPEVRQNGLSPIFFSTHCAPLPGRRVADEVLIRGLLLGDLVEFENRNTRRDRIAASVENLTIKR